MTDFQAQFLSLMHEIESAYPVTQWKVGEVPAWPLARASLHGNLFLQTFLNEKGREQVRFTPPHGRMARAASYALTPLGNIWRSLGQLQQLILLPRRAGTLFLGDGESGDRIGTAWRDRYCDPLIDYLQSKGRSWLLMERGDMKPPPWTRPTLLANTIVNWGMVSAAARRLATRLTGSFPSHDQVMQFLNRTGVPTRGLALNVLRQRAAIISATADGFEQLLRTVKPSVCFIVAYE